MNETVKITPSHKSIGTALAAAQMQMGKALKSADNPHFKTKYADLGSVMEACLPALNANGIAVIQPTTDEEGGRYVETVLIHGESGEELRCRVPLIVSKNDMQGYGSAVTYARRYGLMSMAGIAPEDDDGNAAAKSPPVVEQRRQEPQGPSKEALTIAANSLVQAATLDALQAIWRDLPRDVQAAASVIAAKDWRKTELTTPKKELATANADLGGDEIPY